MAKPMNELIKKTRTELVTLLAEKREQLREFRFSAKGTRIRNTKEGVALRKDIARILALLDRENEPTTTD
jgi:ribosomal protein L29